MDKLDPKSAKPRSFVIIGAYVAMVCVLALVSFIRRESNTPEPSTGVAILVLGAISTVSCLAWTWLRLWPRSAVGERPEPIGIQQYLTRMIIALGLAEFAAILGFVMAPALQELRYVAFLASLGCIVGAILPATLRYWSLVDQR